VGASLLVGQTIRTARCTYHRNLLLRNIAKRWRAPRRRETRSTARDPSAPADLIPFVVRYTLRVARPACRRTLDLPWRPERCPGPGLSGTAGCGGTYDGPSPIVLDRPPARIPGPHSSMAWRDQTRPRARNATAHQCRHWFATEVYANCHDIRVTQELLGHSDPSTTAG
jgi:hypothetical protein